MGLLDRFHDLPGCKTFYFRVRTPKGYTFDSAIVHHKTLTEAFDALKKIYPATTITVLEEKEFDADGLPSLKLSTTVKGIASG